MRLKKFGFLILPAVLLGLSSCLGDNKQEDYSEWMNQNLDYINKAEASGRYLKVVPPWDKASFVLMEWHNDRQQTSNNLTPLDNSTIAIKYMLRSIEGDTIDSSYNNTTWGDSIYQCKPKDMITGFWVATTNMHVGDSVTAIVPYVSGYGISGSGSVKPYSTLIFEIKLDSIVSWESLPWRD